MKRKVARLLHFSPPIPNLLHLLLLYSAGSFKHLMLNTSLLPSGLFVFLSLESAIPLLIRRLQQLPADELVKVKIDSQEEGGRRAEKGKRRESEVEKKGKKEK